MMRMRRVMAGAELVRRQIGRARVLLQSEAPHASLATAFSISQRMTTMRSVLVVLTALLPSGSAALAQTGEPCASDIKTLCAGISTRRRPDQGLHKIAFDRAVANLPGPLAHGGGDGKGVQDRR